MFRLLVSQNQNPIRLHLLHHLEILRQFDKTIDF
jgi:hypothetical protein